jgi:hypothetical protein
MASIGERRGRGWRVERNEVEAGDSMALIRFGFLLENWKDLSHWLTSNGHKSAPLNGLGQIE